VKRTRGKHAAGRPTGNSGSRTPVGTVIAAVAVSAVVLAMLAMPVFGLKMYVITGGSMNGSIGRGALILDKIVPVSSLRVGDIITFRPPQGSGPVTHRIIAIERQADGEAVFRTKGDFNKTADPWQFTLDRPVQAKYMAQIPYLGYALALLSFPIVRAVLFAVPALVAVLLGFLALWRRSGEARWLGRSRTAGLEAEYEAAPRQYRRVSRGR
jgi:signal peptidase I